MTPKSAITCFLAILIITLSGCSRLYFFEGIIMDGDGQPIAGASIMLYPHDWDRPSQIASDGTSGDDGKFEATWGNAVGVEYFRLVVSVAGYREHDRLVPANEKNLRIVMERIPDTDGSGNETG